MRTYAHGQEHEQHTCEAAPVTRRHAVDLVHEQEVALLRSRGLALVVGGPKVLGDGLVVQQLRHNLSQTAQKEVQMRA